jgi:PAS domain-containing protein
MAKSTRRATRARGFSAPQKTATAFVDLSGVIQYVNPAWTALFGPPKLGKEALEERVKPEERAALARAIGGLRIGIAADLHLRFVRADGLEICAACELCPDEESAGFYVAARLASVLPLRDAPDLLASLLGPRHETEELWGHPVGACERRTARASLFESPGQRRTRHSRRARRAGNPRFYLRGCRLLRRLAPSSTACRIRGSTSHLRKRR